ncbi:putative nuclease HARBI1 [Periplaneta americana]|uniref:putative nuclease HARBI1 n=1 Tax=Periplaneta americana TaxID=6978 RepID=UPI0037E90A62
MDNEFEEMIEEVNELQEIRAPKRYLRNVMNPFEFYNDIEFKRRFRFHKRTVLDLILPKIERTLAKPNQRGLPVPPVLQLLICLRFYATGSFQIVIGDLCSLSQSTVSRVVNRVSRILALHIRHHIRMPLTQQEKATNRLRFEELGRGGNPNNPVIPSVDGAIDCMHVRLCHTKFGDHAESFRNRKNYFSLNVQAVAGPEGQFLDIVSSWAGSEHDSRIFHNSRLYVRYVQGTTEPTRCVVERMFGVWKKRFPCLSVGLRNKLENAPNIIVACVVLHNLSLEINDNLPEDDPDIMILPYEPVPVAPPVQQPGGLAFRRELINRVFRKHDDEM